jgi:plastocyanin
MSLISKVLYSVAAVLVLGTTACSDDSSGPASGITVNMQASSFSPTNLSVPTGATVIWRNQTATAHNITPDNPTQPGVWTATNIDATLGAQFNHNFSTAGVFNYHCTIHAGMTGTITVQ